MKIEEAAARMHELAKGELAQRLEHANEAETRLLLIDRILSILGWIPEEYRPEQVTSTGLYTDYLLTVDGQPRLIIEAKRFGLVSPISKSFQQDKYTNAYLHRNCGSEMSSLLDQCRIYCSDTGIQYAIATTGDIWVVLLGFTSGVEWGKIRSFVFHSLKDIAERFNSFYELISRESVKGNRLEEEFSSMTLIRPSVVIRPRSKIEDELESRDVPYRRAISTFFDMFMSDIISTDKKEMLDRCYVENREIGEFSRDLRGLLEYDAVLDEQDQKIREADEKDLKDEIEYLSESGSHRIILLVGRIGSGKSTFIHRFITGQSRPKNHICTVIDLINQATFNVNQDREEEQNLAEIILNKLHESFEDKFNPYEPSILKGCFYSEIKKFKLKQPQLYQRRQEEYMLQEEKFLNELSNNKYKHLVGYAKYIARKNYKIWITLDNIDQGTDSYQSFVYSFAHRLSSDSGCVVLITMREDTFLEAQARGFLNVRNSDFVFRLRPPDLRQVISKRRKYVEYILTHKSLRRLSDNKKLVEALVSHIKLIMLNDDDIFRKIISSFSLGNMRYAFQIMQEYYTSYHSLFHEFYNCFSSLDSERNNQINMKEEYEHFLQALMLGRDWSYDERDSDVFNLFAVDADEQSSHFISILVLAYLSRSQVLSKHNVKLVKLSGDLVFLGYQRHQIEQSVARMLKASLLLSPTLPLGMFREEGLPELNGEMKVSVSAKGYYYLNHLSGDIYYQTRVAEDTIWYDEQRVGFYIKALKESLEVQEQYSAKDYLLATDAREVFIQYLKRAWLQEYQATRVKTQSEWVRVIHGMVEQKIFGSQITQSIYLKDDESPSDIERILPHQPSLSQIVKPKNKDDDSNETAKQLTIFDVEETDYSSLFMDNAKTLGVMPKNTRVYKSRYIIKVLWALELAFRCGFTGIRASHISRIINEYGDDNTASPNVAKFFRNQKRSQEFTQLWKESPDGCYTINSFGRDFLLTHLADI